MLSRGLKGCYVCFLDKDTENFIRSRIDKNAFEVFKEAEETKRKIDDNVLPFRYLKPEEVRPYENCVPLYDLKIAAGQFSTEQQVAECDWVELPDSFRPQKGHFVARVVGESMNKRIPNGAWCLFKANPGGTRNNKVVIVQHRDIQDQDTGASYTVKLYCSEKISEGDEWRHERIVLKPDSYIEGYTELVFEEDSLIDLSVIGELIAVLG